jgi:hypothetical protein
MAVFALSTDSTHFFFTETVSYRFPNLQTVPYRLIVPPGDYLVMAVFRANSVARGAVPFTAAYTKAVQCGLVFGCTDHSPVRVHVGPGDTVAGVDPTDVNGPASHTVVPTLQGWGLNGGDPWHSNPQWYLQTGADPKVIARTFLSWDADLVHSPSTCDTNRACAWISDWRDGQRASYVVGSVGTNGLYRTCTTYAMADPSGIFYRIVDFNCRRVAEAFPVLGGTGQLAYSDKVEPEPKCVNFHASPDLTSRVLTCLPINTGVTIDRGPVYTPQASPNPHDPSLNYWWHVAGKGWVVHHYLVWSA